MVLMFDIAADPVRGDATLFVLALAAIILVLFVVASIAALIIFFVRRRRKALRAANTTDTATPAANEGI